MSSRRNGASNNRNEQSVKRTHLSTAFALAFSLFAAAFAFGESTPVAGTQASDKLDAEQRARLLLGLAVATGGNPNPRAAISEFYDPVIAFYEATYTDKRQRYFSARSETEALLYSMQGAVDQAATTVVSRNWVEAHFMKGFALVDLQQLDAARVEYETALKLAPHNSQVLAELGDLYNREKNFTKALETFRLAETDSEYSPPEAKDHDRARAWRGQGYAYTELKQWDVAEKMYRQSLALDKNDQRSVQELQYIQKQRSAQAANAPH
jgi:Flp pilus assembly protein TadD